MKSENHGASDRGGGSMPEFVTVGEVLRPQGRHGELKVRPLTTWPARFFDLGAVFVRGAEFCLLHCRLHGSFVYVKLRGIDTIDEAEKLRGAFLQIPSTEVHPLPQDSYYHFQLVGCTVMDDREQVIGRVKEVREHPANDLLVVEQAVPSESQPSGRNSGGAAPELVIPLVKGVIQQVNLQEKTIIVRLQREERC